MNIFFVSKECPPSPRSSGIGTYVWETSNALARNGHNVTVLAASDDGQFSQSSPYAGLTIVRLPDDELQVERRGMAARALFSGRNQRIAYRKRILQFIENRERREKPDVIEFCGFRGESVLWLAESRRIPMVVRMHGLTGGTEAGWRNRVLASRRLQVAWERQEVAAADVVTVVSKHEASLVRRQFSRDHVDIVYNSIDSERWRKLSATATPMLESSDILFVGSLLKKKGVFTLLCAARQLRETGWRGRLMLAGKSTGQFERFLKLRSSLGSRLPEWVVHLGVCRREDLAGLYRDAGVCCFPSLAEGFSYTCLEAMASGGIVIGSRGTGMAEVLSDCSGVLTEPGDADELVTAIHSVLTMSDERRARMKQAARERASSHFSHSAIMPKLLKSYEKAISVASERTLC